MRYSIPELQIDETEGFGKQDLFERSKIAEGLTNVLLAASEPIVLAVDGKWGTGKTVFLKMWAGELRKNGFPVVYFDAFENDYQEDAFLAIAGRIFSLIEERDAQTKPRAQKYAARAKQVGKVLARSGLKVALKAATLGALSSRDQEDIADEVAEAATKDVSSEVAVLFDKYVGEMITDQKALATSIEEFRNALSQLPKTLQALESPDGEKQSANEKPLIFLIDELDRCRPPFALNALERIKHFFNVPNVHFVLGCNIEQLHAAVESVYGSRIDAHNYLLKFIHLSIPLPRSDSIHSPPVDERYIDHLREKMGFDSELGSELAASITSIAKRQQLDLRSIERIMTVAALLVAYNPEIDPKLSTILAGLCVLKVKAPHVYSEIKGGSWSYKSIETALGLHATDDDIEDYELNWAKQTWRYFSNDPMEANDRNEVRDWYRRHTRSNPQKLIVNIANQRLDRFGAN